MRYERAFRTRDVVLIATIAMFASLATIPLQSGNSGTDEVLTRESIQTPLEQQLSGVAYVLAEVECRQWHRNRACRPYNFALKQ